MMWDGSHIAMMEDARTERPKPWWMRASAIPKIVVGTSVVAGLLTLLFGLTLASTNPFMMMLTFAVACGAAGFACGLLMEMVYDLRSLKTTVYMLSGDDA